MLLAIADPPFPPNLLAASRRTGHGAPSRASRWYGPRGTRSKIKQADIHPEAYAWDQLERHTALLQQLRRDYAGWAIATTMDCVAAGVYDPLPYGTRVLTWVKPNALPPGSRIHTMCEAVLAFPPEGRYAGRGEVPDVLIAAPPNLGFVGAKPPQWTRWVLDALGYDPDQDVVHDLFPGSGAVAAEIAQGTLI